MRSTAPAQNRDGGSPAAKRANFTLDDPLFITKVAPIVVFPGLADRNRVPSAILNSSCVGSPKAGWRLWWFFALTAHIKDTGGLDSSA
jgi:hypothetical protein